MCTDEAIKTTAVISNNLHKEIHHTNPHTDFHRRTRSVVSRVAYLTGVPLRIFENEHEAPQLDWYEKLEKNQNARIIRNLCILRTDFIRNYGKIMKAFRDELKNITTMPEYISKGCVFQLEKDGIAIPSLSKNIQPCDIIIKINQHIANRINNCKDIFPIWLNWEYVKSLFIMPNGYKPDGTKAAANEYFANKNSFPYQVYVNWPAKGQGNILYDDYKFCTLLYQVHEDVFNDVSKVLDAGDLTKNQIYRFLEESGKTAIVVDCENVDPFKLHATLTNLNENALLSKICKIILYNDINATTAWDILKDFTSIPVEHIMTQRIKVEKSQVDMSLAIGTCKEFYENKTDSFILAGSDSDYWSLVSSLPQIRFLVMVESAKFSNKMKEALDRSCIAFCYMDDFCTGNSYDMKVMAMLKEIRLSLQQNIKVNIKDILADAYRATRAEMTTAEEKQFFEKYIKPMKLVIEENGDLAIELGA